jgi:hypothetical protein
MENVEENWMRTMFWLEFTVGLSVEYRSKVKPLWRREMSLTAIIVSSIITTKKNNKDNFEIRARQ